MIRFLLPMFLLCNLAWADQVICHDVNGKVISYDYSSPPVQGCLNLSPPYTSTQEEYDRVKELFKTVPRQHIIVKSGSPSEMSQADKDTVDAEMAQDTKTREIARIDAGEVSGGEVLKAVAAISQESLTHKGLTESAIKEKIKEQEGLT